MNAAPPGIITLTAVRGDGTSITAAVRFDPVIGILHDPAVLIDGTGSAVLHIRTADGTADIPVSSGGDLTAATLAALGADTLGDIGALALRTTDPP